MLPSCFSKSVYWFITSQFSLCPACAMFAHHFLLVALPYEKVPLFICHSGSLYYRKMTGKKEIDSDSVCCRLEGNKGRRHRSGRERQEPSQLYIWLKVTERCHFRVPEKHGMRVRVAITSPRQISLECWLRVWIQEQTVGSMAVLQLI